MRNNLQVISLNEIEILQLNENFEIWPKFSEKIRKLIQTITQVEGSGWMSD